MPDGCSHIVVGRFTSSKMPVELSIKRKTRGCPAPSAQSRRLASSAGCGGAGCLWRDREQDEDRKHRQHHQTEVVADPNVARVAARRASRAANRSSPLGRCGSHLLTFTLAGSGSALPARRWEQSAHDLFSTQGRRCGGDEAYTVDNGRPFERMFHVPGYHRARDPRASTVRRCSRVCTRP